MAVDMRLCTEKLERPSQGAAVAVKAEYKQDLAAWLECQFYLPEALEIIEQCMVKKEILLAAYPNKKALASEILEGLISRFRCEIEDELGDLIRYFTYFVILTA